MESQRLIESALYETQRMLKVLLDRDISKRPGTDTDTDTDVDETVVDKNDNNHDYSSHNIEAMNHDDDDITHKTNHDSIEEVSHNINHDNSVIGNIQESTHDGYDDIIQNVFRDDDPHMFNQVDIENDNREDFNEDDFYHEDDFKKVYSPQGDLDEDDLIEDDLKEGDNTPEDNLYKDNFKEDDLKEDDNTPEDDHNEDDEDDNTLEDAIRVDEIYYTLSFNSKRTGLEIAPSQGFPTVVGVAPESEADTNGVRLGDIIVSINNNDVTCHDYADYLSALFFPRPTKVVFKRL